MIRRTWTAVQVLLVLFAGVPGAATPAALKKLEEGTGRWWHDDSRRSPTRRSLGVSRTALYRIVAVLPCMIQQCMRRLERFTRLYLIFCLFHRWLLLRFAYCCFGCSSLLAVHVRSCTRCAYLQLARAWETSRAHEGCASRKRKGWARPSLLMYPLSTVSRVEARCDVHERRVVSCSGKEVDRVIP